jgi:hypothetical protein
MWFSPHQFPENLAFAIAGTIAGRVVIGRGEMIAVPSLGLNRVLYSMDDA